MALLKEDAMIVGCLLCLAFCQNLSSIPFHLMVRYFCIYGDLAYPHRLHLQCPFPAAHLTQEQQAFNESMSSARESVEWIFGEIINYYKFVDFKKNLKIGLSSVGKTYSVCALLRNA